jgi:hypothetical protein
MGLIDCCDWRREQGEDGGEAEDVQPKGSLVPS